MAFQQPAQFKVEGAQILWPNFAGRETQMNAAGKRNFCIVLTPEQGEQLIADGWNVKINEPREEGDDPFYYITVKVNFGARPPRVVLVTSKGNTNLDESTAELADFADIRYADVICNAYEWTVAGKSGRTAYAKTVILVIDEDDLELKYGINEARGGKSNAKTEGADADD